MNHNTSHPQPLPLDSVNLTNGFWAHRQTINRTKTIPAIYHHLVETGRLAAWDLSPDREMPKRHKVVYMFWDSDTAKWLEAVAYSLHTHPDSALEQQADTLITRIQNAQHPDGYINTYFTVLEPENQWRNLRDWHELYNAGHLIEGAVAYYEATGKSTYLDIMRRFADLIDTKFGPNPDQKPAYPGHPELELALVKLFHATGDQRYLDLSTYFINQRGQEPHYFTLEAQQRGENPQDFWAKTYHYCQAHQPIRGQTTAAGHAVRACYLYAGIADIALETDDSELLDVSRRLWDDLTQHQMYITGGLGPAHSHEGFTFAYDLPNESAYAETCASIALVFWAQRMFALDPHARYIDVMERALYNGVLSGVSHDGTSFFYTNPLTAHPSVNPNGSWSHDLLGQHYRRQEWFLCPCCPPNLARLIASIGYYCYSITPSRLYVHLFNTSTAHFDINNQPITLHQSTNYPWDETITFTIQTDQPTDFELALRIPAWCNDFDVTLNNQPQSLQPQNGYIILSNTWNNADTLTLKLSMPVERILPHPNIRQNAGHIALQRGPIVYCLEEVDNGNHLNHITIPHDAQLTATFDPNLFGGIITITGHALRSTHDNWPNDLYLPASRTTRQNTSFQFKAIPYFLWANRQPGEMRVWIRET